MNAINLAAKLSTFSEYWQPRVVGSFNGHDLMVVKVKGEFVWHKHDDTDDFFLVLVGHITIQLRDGAQGLLLGACEVIVIAHAERIVDSDHQHFSTTGSGSCPADKWIGESEGDEQQQGDA